MDILMEDLAVLPIWLSCNWISSIGGVRCVKKLVAPIGKVVKTDLATERREKLQYARVMVEVKVEQTFRDQLSFINNKGRMWYFELGTNGSLIYVQNVRD